MLPHYLFQQVFPVIALMPVGALLVLTLVLWQGDLCPGQRSRISANLSLVWCLFGVSLLLGLLVKLSLLTLFFGAFAFASGSGLSLLQYQLDGKRTIPVPLITLPLVSAVLYSALIMLHFDQASMLLTLVLCGGALGHLLLLRARHRLQAFNALLPMTGVFAAALSMLLILLFAWQHDDLALLDNLAVDVVTRAGLLLGGILIWCLPMLTRLEYKPVFLSMAVGLLLLSETMGVELLNQLT